MCMLANTSAGARKHTIHNSLMPVTQAYLSHHQIVIWICFWFCICQYLWSSTKMKTNTEMEMLSNLIFTTHHFTDLFRTLIVWPKLLVQSAKINQIPLNTCINEFNFHITNVLYSAQKQVPDLRPHGPPWYHSCQEDWQDGDAGEWVSDKSKSTKCKPKRHLNPLQTAFDRAFDLFSICA